MSFALWAGEPCRFDKDAPGGAGAQNPAQGGGQDANPGSDKFDLGYGKGIEKGKREGVAELLSSLGLDSPDAAKAAIAKAKTADEAAKKAAEEQGQFEDLYKQEKAAREKDSALMADLRKRVEAFEAGQKAEIEALGAKLSDDQKKLLDGLPLDRQLQLAKALTATAGNGAVGAPAGKGGAPSPDGAKTLAQYEKIGWDKLTPEQRAHAKQLQAEQGKETVSELSARLSTGLGNR